MSIKKWRLKRKEAKKQAYRDNLAGVTGLYFSETIEADYGGFPWSKYIVNAIALFGAVYGALNCFYTAFKFDFNSTLLMGVCLVLSVIMSFMYTNEKIKIGMYVMLFMASFSLVANFFIQINSGVSAIHNLSLDRIQLVMELAQVQEYTEYYDDQYISMTFAFSVMALAMMILMNIAISEYMSFWAVFIMTFPFVQYGMFFSFDSSKTGMVLVLASWILVASVRYTNSYNGLTKSLESVASVKKHDHRYGFLSDGNNVSRIALIILTFVVLLSGSLMSVVSISDFEIPTPLAKLRSETNEVAKKYLAYGISVFFGSNASRNNPGEISNSRSISYDGQTDMTVTMVNDASGRIYLRDFVGVDYEANEYKWSALEDGSSEYFSKTYNRSGEILAYDSEHNQALTLGSRKMTIEIMDLTIKSKGVNNGFNLYTPYYTDLTDESGLTYSEEGSVSGGTFSENEPMDFTYYTIDNANGSILDVFDDEETELEYSPTGADEVEYYELIKEKYLDVPEINQDAIEKFLDKYEIKETDPDVVNEVINALADNFDYTLKPGKVPYGEEYVNYFLNSSHKGYCVHFATAATLIFRYLGLPARFAEGYVIDSENLDYATEVSGEAKAEWLAGTDYSSDVDVVSVDIPDSNAHAWVELYLYGFGWQPVEVTNSASIDDDSMFSSIFGGASSISNSAAQDVINTVSQVDIKSTTYGIAAFFVVVLSTILIFVLGRMTYIVTKRRRGFNTAKFEVNISNRYQYIYALYQYVYGKCERELSYSEFCEVLYDKEVIDSDNFCESIENAMFAGDKIDLESYNEMVSVLKDSKKKLSKDVRIAKRFRYCLIDVMW